MDKPEAQDWLAFLLKRQPHKRLELLYRHSQLYANATARKAAIRRLEGLAMQYPTDYLVFQTQRRLTGKQ